MRREFCCWVKPYTLFLGKIMPVAYGIKKLQISCKVEDEKCGTDFLEEKITEMEDLVSIITCILYSFYHYCYCCYYLQMREIVAVMNTTLISSFKIQTVQAWIFFFKLYFHQCLSSVYYCNDHFHLHWLSHSSNIWNTCIHSHLSLSLL